MSGGEVVALLAEWFDAIGLCLERSPAELAGRVVTAVRTVGAGSLAADTTRGGREWSAVVDVEVDLDRVADLVRACGVECEIDTPGGVVAVLHDGSAETGSRWGTTAPRRDRPCACARARCSRRRPPARAPAG